MNNNQWISVVKDFGSIINSSDNINDVYNFMLYMINDEMNTHLVKRGSGIKSRKKYNGTYIENKPYWTNELTLLWNEIKGISIS